MGENAPDPFAAALSELLGPLARAMVARGVTLGAANDALKRALLAAALDHAGAGTSDSRISVMTGLHRKDVKRLRADHTPEPGRKTVSRVALLIGYWATAPEYQGHDGHPRALLREADVDGPGFNDLVRRLRLDLAPGTMAQTLVDQGVVRTDEHGRLVLLTTALLPAQGSEELVAAYRRTLSAHLSAATHNLLADHGAPRHFDRIVHSSHLSAASVAELDTLARQKAQRMLEELNARALELQERDAKAAPQARGKFAAGAYVLPRPDTEAVPDKDAPRPAPKKDT